MAMSPMGRRTNAQIKADEAATQAKAEAMILRTAAKVMREYAIPASANVLDVVADAIEKGERTKP